VQGAELPPPSREPSALPTRRQGTLRTDRRLADPV
jgi:hypothetical protein